MRLRTFLICSFFVFSNSLSSQNSKGKSAPFVSSSYNSFKTGESLKFRLHYGIFNASYATLDLEESTINSKNVYKARMELWELDLLECQGPSYSAISIVAAFV